MKRTVVGTLLVFCILAAAFGSAGFHSAELDFEPLAFEMITYGKDQVRRNREPRTTFGLGGSAAYCYSFNDSIGVGARISVETHSFENFHRYTELKATADAKWHPFSFSVGVPVRLYVIGGAGILFGIKDTGDRGVYPLVRAGLSLEAQVSRPVAVKLTALVDDSFQKGSNVFGCTLGVGVTVTFAQKPAEEEPYIAGTDLEGFQLVRVIQLIHTDDGWTAEEVSE